MLPIRQSCLTGLLTVFCFSFSLLFNRKATFDFAVSVLTWKGTFVQPSDLYTLVLREIPQLHSITMSFWLRISKDIRGLRSSGSLGTLISYSLGQEYLSLRWRVQDENPQRSFMETELDFETGQHEKLKQPG